MTRSQLPPLCPRSRQRRALLGTLLLTPFAASAGILDDAPSADHASAQFLPVGEAFRVKWSWSGAGIAVGEFTVAPGYYLYRDRIKVSLKAPAGAQLAGLELPAGEVKEDAYAGRQVVYHRSFSARQAIILPAGQEGAVELDVVWQGCADAGLCYPPVRRSFTLRS